MGWFLNQLQVGCGEFYGQNDTHLRVGWRARWDGEEQESVGLPLERGVLVTKSIDRTTTPTPSLGALKVFLRSFDRTVAVASSILSRINAMDFDLAVAVASTILRATSKRLTRTVAVVTNKGKSIAKRVRGKSGPLGIGTGDIPDFVAVGSMDVGSSQTTVSPTYPAGIQANDIAILAVMWTDAIGLPAYPWAADPGSGWQRFVEATAGSTFLVLWWKRLTGSESGAQNVTLGSGTSLGVAAGSIAAFRGCIEDETPIEVVKSTIKANTNPLSCHTIETLGPNRLVVSYVQVFFDGTSGTTDTPAVELFEQTTASGNDGGHSCSALDAPTAGANGPITRGTAGQGSSSVGIASFALIPQPPGGGQSGNINEALATASLELTHPRTLNRTAAVTSTITRQTQKIISRAVAAASTITSTKTFQRILTRLADVVAALDTVLDAGEIEQVIDATAPTSSSIRRTTAKVLNRSADAAATIGRVTAKVINRTSATSPTILRATAKQISRSVATVTTMVRTTAKRLQAATATLSTMRRQTGKQVSVSTTPAPVLLPVLTYLRTISASVDAAGSIRRSATRTISVATAVASSMQRRLSAIRQFTAGVAVASTIRRTSTRRLTALVASQSTIRRATAKILTAAIASVAGLLETFRGYVPSLRRIVAGLERRLIIAPAEALRRIIAGPQERVVEADEQDRRIVAPAEPRRRIVAPAEPEREAQPGPESRRIVPPPDA